MYAFFFIELSMFWNILFPLHGLFYTHITRKMRYRSSHAFPSNRTTIVSLQCTWFKVSNPSKNTTCITFTSAKKNMFLHFIILYGKSILYPFFCLLVYIYKNVHVSSLISSLRAIVICQNTWDWLWSRLKSFFFCMISLVPLLVMKRCTLCYCTIRKG